tara:strand:+ start:53 stop:1300 length:1248 start_codon:yes stop_codon:yes gene_type:complete
MNEIIIYLAIFITGFIIIELIVRNIVKSINKDFQWLIIEKDEAPKLSKQGLRKFLLHGYDPELGWVRKPNTSHDEIGKKETTTWHIDERGSRKNPYLGSKESKISCYGDSFTFARQVNDDETWEYYLSELTKTNVQNFGVGNYGLDQAVLRLKREFPKNPTKIVIMGIVPDTISRILSMWKHYYEYGNTFGFKPKFKIHDGDLELLKNPINTEKKFGEYEKFLSYIQENDFFYKNKFKNEKISFPYSITILRNLKRNYGIINWVRKSKKTKSKNQETTKLPWDLMSIIMRINLDWRIKLFKDKNTTILFKKIIEEYVNYSKQYNFKPIFILLPQKDDILFIKKKYHFYQKFIDEIMKINGLIFIDITKELLKFNKLDQLYSEDNEYGGHYSKIGNKLLAKIIFTELNYKMNISFE